MTTYISDIAHYNEVLVRVASVRHSLVIGTADIKDLYVKVGAGREPFFGGAQSARQAWCGGAFVARQGAWTELP